MHLSELDPQSQDRKLIHDVIFEGLDDDGQCGDFIFVFGSITAATARVPKAIELYRAHRAPTIILSGGVSTVPEAFVMKDYAVKNGVEESAIWLEGRSTNTKQNVIYSKNMLDKRCGLRNIRNILLVTSAFHMRRCYLTMKTFMPDWIGYSFCAVSDPHTRPDNWWTNEKGRLRVGKEFEKLVVYARNKQIIDYVI